MPLCRNICRDRSTVTQILSRMLTVRNLIQLIQGRRFVINSGNNLVGCIGSRHHETHFSLGLVKSRFRMPVFYPRPFGIIHGFITQFQNIEFAGFIAFQFRHIQPDTLTFRAGKTIIIDTLGDCNMGVFPDEFAGGILKLF